MKDLQSPLKHLCVQTFLLTLGESRMETKSHVNIALPREASWSALGSASTGRACAPRRRCNRCLFKKRSSHTTLYEDRTHINWSIFLVHVKFYERNWNPMQNGQDRHVVGNMVLVCRFRCRTIVAAMFNSDLVVEYAHMYEVMSTCTWPAEIICGYRKKSQRNSSAKLWFHSNGNTWTEIHVMTRSAVEIHVHFHVVRPLLPVSNIMVIWFDFDMRTRRAWAYWFLSWPTERTWNDIMNWSMHVIGRACHLIPSALTKLFPCFSSFHI